MGLALVATIGAAIVAIIGAAGCNSCREEPTIVIRFEPSDADVRPSRPAVVAPSPSPLREAVKKAANECKVSKDCVIEVADCCDCAHGGALHAVPKPKAAAASAHAAHCKQVMCEMMVSTDPSCSGGGSGGGSGGSGMHADCVAGACVMVAKKK